MNRRSFLYQLAVGGTALTFLPWACQRKSDTEILILGGGLAGLYLAYLLEEAGRDYILLEGSDRLGGRLFTHKKLSREVGGRGIGDKYTEVMKLIEALGIELTDITEFMGSPSALYREGILYKTWPDPATNPSRLEFSRLAEAPALDQLNGWYQRPDLDMPYADFLTQLGHSPAEIDLINISANYNDVYETSAINSLHSRAFRQFNGTRRIFNFKNSSADLIAAITATLSRPVYTGKMVKSIIDDGSAIEVKCADGSSYRAHKVVSTLPFSTLREVGIEGSLSDAHQSLIQELGYTKITQIHLQADEPYWEEDGLPTSMWTDTELERVMRLNPHPEAGELVCWVNGKGTAFFDQMSDQEIAAFTLKELREIRPSTEGRVSYVGAHNWGLYPYNKGAYAEFLPGQASLFATATQPAGNIHFAGEHMALESRGIEGAAESARRVFEELVN